MKHGSFWKVIKGGELFVRLRYLLNWFVVAEASTAESVSSVFARRD